MSSLSTVDRGVRTHHTKFINLDHVQNTKRVVRYGIMYRSKNCWENSILYANKIVMWSELSLFWKACKKTNCDLKLFSFISLCIFNRVFFFISFNDGVP